MYSVDLRLSALRLYRSLKSSRHVSRLLGIHHSTVCRWFRRISPLKKVKRCLRKSKSTIDQFIKDTLLTCPLTTQLELLSLTRSSFPSIRISRRTIFESISRIKFTRKRIRRKLRFSSHPQQDRVDTLRTLFKQNRRLFFIDESGFADRHSRLTGYSLRGEECVMDPLKIHFQTSLILGADSTGYLKYAFTSKGVKTDDFINFLKTLQLPANSIIVLDNCAIHKSKKVQQYISERGWELIFLPPYCPDLNPVEYLFGILKGSYRKSLTKSRDVILSLLRSLKLEYIVRSFEHVRKNLQRE